MRYDWIISNPPLHHGQPDDFHVLQGLIDGASQCLRKGGVLWMVAQAQVPVGCFLAAAGGFDSISTTVSTRGRCIVWRAVKLCSHALTPSQPDSVEAKKR